MVHARCRAAHLGLVKERWERGKLRHAPCKASPTSDGGGDTLPVQALPGETEARDAPFQLGKQGGSSETQTQCCTSIPKFLLKGAPW